MDRQTWQS